MGVIAAGSAMGGALCSALASTLLPLIGFAWSCRVLALLFLCLLIFSCIVSAAESVMCGLLRYTADKTLSFGSMRYSAKTQRDTLAFTTTCLLGVCGLGESGRSWCLPSSKLHGGILEAITA